MKNKIIFLAPFLLALLPFPGGPLLAGELPAAYYQVKTRSVSVEETRSVAAVVLPRPVELRAPSKQALALGIARAGLAAWKVFSRGAPSGEASSAYSSAIPPAMFNNWSSVADWEGPNEHIYTYTVTNLMGIDVIKVKYALPFYYGGTEKAAGKTSGRYISNFTVRPISIDVKWGWHFDLDVIMSDPMNIGTVPKPVAMLQADLKWRVYTTLSPKGETGFWTYSMDGNGNFTDITSKDLARTKELPAPAIYGQAPTLAWN